MQSACDGLSQSEGMMSRALIVLTLGCALMGPSVTWAEEADATVEAECTGRNGAQVAIRWGHPTYASNEYITPIFTVPCGVGKRQKMLKILHRDSQFEIQTEGGIETAYAVKTTVIRNGQVAGSMQINHQGSPTVVTRGGGFMLSRSSGPNRYGEQNFRVKLSPASSANVRVLAQVTGNRPGAQLAMRWGHPDFHDDEYFDTWTIPAGNAQSKTFRLTDTDSEFELQTEGGVGTGYHVSIWVYAGEPVGMMPSVEISHKLHGSDHTISTNGVTFSRSRGNVYGELNVDVTAPWLPEKLAPLPEWVTVTLRPQGIAGTGPLPYTGTLGFGATGRFTKIRSAEHFNIELVGDGGWNTDCGKDNGKTAFVRRGQEMDPDEFKGLFGANPVYPYSFVGCSWAPGTEPVPAISFQAWVVPDAK